MRVRKSLLSVHAAVLAVRPVLFAFILMLAGGPTAAVSAESSAGLTAVFSGPTAEYEVVPPVDSAHIVSGEPGFLRWVWIEERMNVARHNAPVRVPVFLAAGECQKPEQLVLIRWPSREIVVTQADDVRLGADGGVARLHLWFTTDLEAGGHQRLALVRRNPAPAGVVKSIDAHVTGDRLQIRSAGIDATFQRSNGNGTTLAALQFSDGPSLVFAGDARATTTWSGSASPSTGKSSPPKSDSLSWGSGPVFAKVSSQFLDETGSTVAQVFRIFSEGSLNVIQTVLPSGGTDGQTLASQDFFRGNLVQPLQLKVRPQSAVIIDSLVGVHPGYEVDALLQGGRAHGWLVVPGSLGGVAGRILLGKEGQFRLQAPGGLTRGKGDARVGTVRTYWAEVTFIPARREGEGLERAAVLAAGQPLVAVVERPGVSLSMAVARLQDNVREMKPVGWVNESLTRSLQGKTSPFPKRKWTAEADPVFWVADAQRALSKVTGDSSRQLREDEKGRAAGSLDPYHITYDTTALVHWLLHGDLPSQVRDSLRARMEAVRRQLGRVNEEGWPYLDVFFRTQNMQMGPPLLTLADSGADPALRQYYRDQLSAPTLGAVMLRGLRPYQGRAQAKPEESDTVYQAVVDFMLRATELSLNESLGLQRVAFGRYLDAIDVNADLCHPAHPRTDDEGGRFARANFFRTQSHLHRWLAWGPSPFIALLQPPLKESEGRFFPGATEAWQFANVLSGRWKNWPDQSWLFLSSVLPEKAAVYTAAPRPAVAVNVRVQRQAGGNHVSWDKTTAAASYRIFRLRPGLPPLWLNSPYRTGSRQTDLQTEILDAEGKSDDGYLVHVVDQIGRESGW
jgi:hypothetical protein